MLSMKPTLNLRQIDAFASVMRTGSVVGAAQLMNVTQPAVSRAVSLLELRIGYKLFERRGRRLVPTPEGEALFREIEPIYGSLDRIAQATQDIRFQRTGALRIATLPALSQWVIPRAIAGFLSTRPNVSIFVQSLPSRQIAELVATRQCDVGIVELPLSRPGIAIEPLEPASTMAVMPSGHRLASKRQLSLRDLGAERMILLSQHSFLRYHIEDAFSQLGVAPQVVLETPNSLMACALVAAGAGITMVPRWAAESFAGPAVVVRPVKEKLSSRCAIIFPDPGARLALADAFTDYVREELRKVNRR
ncbi:MAG: LysR family transcriptional regulator [Ramlibacter sp.]